MTDELVMDDDEVVEDEGDPVVAATRRAREALEATRMTPEQEAEHEERCRQNRLAEYMAPRQYEQRRAPIAEIESRQEADRLARVVEVPPAPRPPPVFTEMQKQVIGKVVAKLQKRYTDALEEAVGKLHGELLRRHESTEGRTTGIEARLAQIEARLAALEARGVFEPEKTGP